ncbi:hypothetical protein IKZ77_00250, partial [Candidatus Saccharibacteria bacterium]|nr:hypothetical protein [Candidatus Saccharibacteria bacterium]
LAEEIVEESVTIGSLDPDGRPMQKIAEQPAEKPKKKKKTGLIIGIIIALLLAIGGGVVAAILLMNSKDPVVSALEKLTGEQAPEKIKIDGQAKISINHPDSLVSEVNINLDGAMETKSSAKTMDADMELVLADGNKTSLKYSSISNLNDDLYLKIDGLSDMSEKLLSLSTAATMEESEELLNTLSDEEREEFMKIMEENSQTQVPVMNTLEGEWIKTSTAEILSLMSGMAMTDGEMACDLGSLYDLSAMQNVVAEIYGKYPFLSSTTENVEIASKFDPVRKIVIDEEKLAGFINAYQSVLPESNIYGCLYENEPITTDGVSEMVSQLPDIYAEIDNNGNFTRVYMEMESDDGNATMMVDISISYPTTINIIEPIEYVNLMDVFQEMITNMLYMNEGLEQMEIPLETPFEFDFYEEV